MSETTSAKKKSPLWLWIIAAVVLMLCLFLIYKTAQANEDLDAKSNELMEYVDAIDAANKKTHEMEEEIRYRATDEYIEEAARDIGLIDPDETIISPED